MPTTGLPSGNVRLGSRICAWESDFGGENRGGRPAGLPQDGGVVDAAVTATGAEVGAFGECATAHCPTRAPPLVALQLTLALCVLHPLAMRRRKIL